MDLYTGTLIALIVISVFTIIGLKYTRRNYPERVYKHSIPRYFVNTILCHGTWEKKFVEYCFANKIPVKRFNYRPFDYKFRGKVYLYHPDFVIEENGEEVIIEIKGVLDAKSQAKYTQHKDKVRWLFKEDLLRMGILLPEDELDLQYNTKTHKRINSLASVLWLFIAGILIISTIYK